MERVPLFSSAFTAGVAMPEQKTSSARPDKIEKVE
jgi:hypothetical protein